MRVREKRASKDVSDAVILLLLRVKSDGALLARAKELLLHSSKKELLCPRAFVPKSFCAQELLCPRAFVPKSFCAQRNFLSSIFALLFDFTIY